MTGLVLALALAASQPQADEPRILDSAARLAAEVQLQQSVQRGGRRAIQRIPRAVKIAMVVAGAAVFYIGYHHVETSWNKKIWTMAVGASTLGLGAVLLERGQGGSAPFQPPRGGRGGRQ